MPKRRITVQEYSQWLVDQSARAYVEGVGRKVVWEHNKKAAKGMG